MSMVPAHGLSIDKELHEFIVGEALPGTGVEADHFFNGLASLIHDLSPKNRELLATREHMQDQIDAWHRKNGAPTDLAASPSSGIASVP